MKSTITFSKEDEDQLLVTMKYVFDESRGPTLRKRLGDQHYRLYPMDNSKMPVGGVALLTGQANTSKQNEFVIQRIYEITQEYDENVALAKEHAERYYQRVMEELKDIP
jgi:hypothetical protein